MFRCGIEEKKQELRKLIRFSFRKKIIDFRPSECWVVLFSLIAWSVFDFLSQRYHDLIESADAIHQIQRATQSLCTKLNKINEVCQKVKLDTNLQSSPLVGTTFIISHQSLNLTITFLLRSEFCVMR
jgi:hypothetical protein